MVGQSANPGLAADAQLPYREIFHSSKTVRVLLRHNSGGGFCIATHADLKAPKAVSVTTADNR
jgi:hypothetical protein